jgi:hypothetical protein
VLTAEGRPVLTDLGVARPVGSPDSGEVTPPYVDPVVARGGAAGPASDVFGVAAAAFHALTGIPPWNAAGPGGTLEVAASGQVPDLALLAPEAPAELVAVVTRGLSPHPQLRGSAAEFALDLRHSCRPERIALPAPGADPAAPHRADHVPRTELTHQVRRPARAHAAPERPGRWAAVRERVGAALPQGGGVLRRAGAALAAVAALLAAVWTGVQWGSPDTGTVPAARTQSAAQVDGATPASPPRTDPAPTTAPDPTGAGEPVPAGTADPGGGADSSTTPTDPAGWAALVGELYARRATAFTTGRAADLSGVYTGDSPLLAADADQVSRLVAAGQILTGFAPEVLGVGDVTPVPGGARLVLTDRVPDYLAVTAGSAQPVPGRAERTVVMTLLRTPTGWRIDAAELAA